MQAAVLADDLTGALDTGVQFVRAGLRVRVVLPWPASPTARDLLQTDGADVVVVDTETRSAPPALAAERVTSVAEALLAAGARRFYKKIDSTLRGPWVEELDALARFLRVPHTLVCPAFPPMGRTVRGGRVWVHGEAGPDLRSQLEARSPQPARYAVPEAGTNADLDRLARHAVETGEDRLLCGSAGLAAAWAPLLSGAGLVAAEGVAACTEVLIVAGSRSAGVVREVTRLATVTELSILTGGATRLLRVPAGEGEEDPSVVQELAEVAKQHHRKRPADGWVLTGGETAVQVLRALGVERLTLVREALPGLPLSIAHGGQVDGARIITKAGGFGGPQALESAARLLLAAPRIDR